MHFNPAQKAAPAVFSLLLLAIFATELAVMDLLDPLFARLEPLPAGLIDATILVMIYAGPLWAFAVRPMSGANGGRDAWLRTGRFFAALFVIFLDELLVMLVMPYIMPHGEAHIRGIVDASLNLLSCAPFLWLLLFRHENRRSDTSLIGLLETPLRLYCLLLFTIFLVDLSLDLLVPRGLQGMTTVNNLVESFLTTLIISPFLWMFVLRPLKSAALAEKTRADALWAQVVDAVVTIDAHGVVDSLNPAAERIFGFAAGEMTGTPVARLFLKGEQALDELLRTPADGSGDGSTAATGEIPALRRDGSTVLMEVSVSRVLFGGRERFLIIMRDISTRKEMELALRESEERFDIALNGANDGIWDWDLQTGRIYCSPRLKELLGFHEEAFPEDSVWFQSLIHPDDRARIRLDTETHLRERTPYDNEYRLRTRQGEYRWFRTRGQGVWAPSGEAVRMVGFISDITNRKQAEQALRESETRFRQIFEQSEDAIIFFKPGTCRIIDVNPPTERLYGFAKAELLAEGLTLFTKAGDVAMLQRAISGIRDGETVFLEKTAHLRRDGTEVLVSMRGKVMTLQGVNIICCTFRDITERIRMEEEAREIQAKLIQTNKMTSLGLLISGVAHEINNPNNFILASSQLLSRTWEDALKVLREYYRENGEFYIGGLPFSQMEERSPDLFAGITDGSRRINEIIGNLKSFARQGPGMDERGVDVNEVVTGAVSILHHQIARHTENFHLDLAESVPRIRGKKQQLGQVVINLVMNACQALSDKSREIRVATGFDAAAGCVTITVRDEGTGMSREISSRITEPFFTTKLDSGGTGLGLSISQSIVKEHLGSMEFSSEPNAGTTVVVRIPAGPPAEKEQAA